MVIIDKNTEKTLLLDAQDHLTHGRARRCLHIALSSLDKPNSAAFSQLVRATQDYFKNDNGQIYITQDNDLWVSTGQAHRRVLAEFLKDIPKRYMPDFEAKKSVTLFETGINWNELIVICREKAYAIEDEVEKTREIKRDIEAEEKRQKSLKIQIDPNHIASIAARREARKDVQILVVEDDLFTQKLVKNTLNDHAEVITAKTGYEAITSYADIAPDLLFLDIGLPDVTGHELLGKILSMDPKAYIVMLSGNGDRDNVIKAVELGAKGFVGKPFTKDKLIQYTQKSPHILAKKS